MKKTLYVFLLCSNELSWENVWLIFLEFLFLNQIFSDDLGVERGIQEVKANIWEPLALHPGNLVESFTSLSWVPIGSVW